MRRGLIGGIGLAVLWFAFGWGSYLLQGAGGSLATLGQLLPSPMRYGMFGLPLGWSLVVHVLVAIALVAGYAAVAIGLGGRRGVTFAGGWLAAIITAFLIGASLDLGSFAVWLGPFGVRGALGTMGATPLTAWWGVLVGWIPALAMIGGRKSVAAPQPAPARALSRVAVGAAVIAVVALVALPLAAQAGHAATQDELQRQQTEAEVSADPDGAAAPDPDAAGEAVPTVADTGIAVSDDACTAANTTILAPPADGATGHRAQSLQLVNTSDTDCVIDGYPDVAFGDQNGHLLDVTIEHGSSFMAQDPGAQPITVAPGEAVLAVIGWDANSVHGQLAARSLWSAAHPGAVRLAWDVSLDIVSGSTVHVTAWHVRAPAGQP